jgi:magnesium-transporting ATPase (P-type)
VAASYRNLKVFFKKQGWIFLLLGILFFLVSLVLTELFSFAKYQLEQEMGDSKKYLNLFYGTYSTTVRTELLWTAAVLVFIGMMCFLFFFSFRSSDKKKR